MVPRVSKKPRFDAVWFLKGQPADGRAASCLFLDSGNCAELVLGYLEDLSSMTFRATSGGDWSDAVEYSEALLRLRELSRKSILLQPVRYSYDMFDSWYQLEAELLATGQFSKEQLESHLEELQSNRPMPCVRDCIDQECRFRLLDLLQQIGKHGADCVVDSRGHWVKLLDIEKDYNEVTNLYRAAATADINAEAVQINNTIDEFVRILDNPTVASRWPDLRTALETFDMFYGSGRQPLRSLLIVGYRDPFLEMVRWEVESMIEHELACVATALELYRKENGSYPGSLKALVPKYLAVEPQDPINQSSFQYSAKGDSVLMFSFGIDGTHDGGMNRDEAGLVGSDSYDHRYLNGKLSDF